MSHTNVYSMAIMRGPDNFCETKYFHFPLISETGWPYIYAVSL